MLPGDAWHLSEPRASPGDLEQAEVSCIPALCTVLPCFIQNLNRTLVSGELFGIIIWSSLVTVYYILESNIIDILQFPIVLFASPIDVAVAQSKKYSPGL